MKAYMSAPWPGPSILKDRDVQEISAAVALTEAQRILAETEDEEHECVRLIPADLPSWWGNEEREALAAGLAWFIALDIKGDLEGLAH